VKTATLEILSPRAFGQAIGVSRQAVVKAIRSGRLKEALSKDERTGYHRIELVRGRSEWEAWADPSMRPKGKKPPGRPAKGARGTPSLFDTENDRARKTEQVTLARASAVRVSLDAELKQFELDTLRGNLIDKREVQREAFRLARSLRDRLQAIPDRISAQLAALDKPAQVHEALAGEIAKALEAMDEREEEEEP
jgi:hypothetical protein